MEIAPPGPLYKRWLTTRPVFRQQELVVWYVEIDIREEAKRGKIPEIVLSEENMICLLAK